jgi:hypothetical protein
MTNCDKFLVLDFKNAGFFNKNPKTNDVILEYDTYSNRGSAKQFVEPITYFQISNMLHVLFGERPSPSLRGSIIKPIDYLVTKAKESYLRIDTMENIKPNKNGRKSYPSEVIQLKKAVWNSFSTNGFLNWYKVKKSIGIDKFNTLKELILTHMGIDIGVVSCNEFVKKWRLVGGNMVVEEYLVKTCVRKPFVDYFKNDESKKAINNVTGIKRTNLMGIDTITKLDGRILVPVNDDDIIRIKNWTGCATLLDGGLVRIVGLEIIETTLVDDYTLVGDISVEKH